MAKDTKTYELTFLLRSDLNDQELEGCLKKVAEMIANKGNITKSEPPKKIKLSYPIQKKQEGALATHQFKAEPPKIAELKTELEKMPQVLRFLLIKKEAVEKKGISEEAKATMRPKKKPIPAAIKPIPPALKEEPLKKKKVELKEIEESLDKILDFHNENKVKPQSEL